LKTLFIACGALAKAKAIADSMGWEFEHRQVGYGDLETRLVELMRNGAGQMKGTT
jgi:hypothetical protein